MDCRDEPAAVTDAVAASARGHVPRDAGGGDRDTVDAVRPDATDGGATPLRAQPDVEARRRQFQRVGKLLRNEDETVILSYLTPQQGLKKQAQLQRWVDRMIEQGDPAINEFSKLHNASERHTLRQHVLRIHRDIKQQVSEEELEASKRKFVNYVQQVALLSEQ